MNSLIRRNWQALSDVLDCNALSQQAQLRHT